MSEFHVDDEFGNPPLDPREVMGDLTIKESLILTIMCLCVGGAIFFAAWYLLLPLT